MLWREIAPKGRGKIFGCGFACAGSAGSRGAVCCASAGMLAISSAIAAPFAAFLASVRIVLVQLLMCSAPQANWPKKGIGILREPAAERHRANSVAPALHLNACESEQIN